MDEAGNGRETRTKATSIGHLSNDTLTDILLRLPAKSVLRAGAVCKAWRRITTDTGFLADHARRQPTNVVLYTYQFSPRCENPRPWFFEDELALDLLPISSSDDDDEAAARRRRRLIRYPMDKNVPFLLLASCNGVLLFERSLGSFLLCNPTTSKWAELPRLPPLPRPTGEIIDEYAFYHHEPSGEYRLLLRRQRHSWFVLSTGAAEPRQVFLHWGLPETMGITTLLRTTPVPLHGRLHWPPHPAAGGGAPAAAGGSETGPFTTKMVLFDTLSETFHLMAGPPTATAEQTKVFDMEGRLAAADFGDDDHVDLWFLEDYDAGRWERRHRVVPSPWHAGTRMPERELRRPKFVAAAGDERYGAVMLGNHLGLLVYSLRTGTAMTVNSVAASEHKVIVSRHVFRESLQQHPSFAARSVAELGVNIFWN